MLINSSRHIHITQYERFVPYSTHPNFGFAETPFMLGTLYEIPNLALKRKNCGVERQMI